MPHDENDPLSMYGGTSFGSQSRENLDRIMNRYSAQEDEPTPPPVPQPDFNKEIENLRSELNGTRSQFQQMQRENQELRSIAERANGATGAMQQYLNTMVRAPQQQQQEQIQVNDPEMAATLASLQRQMYGTISQEVVQPIKQEIHNLRLQNEWNRFRNTVQSKRASDPNFASMYNEETLNNWGWSNIASNPQGAANINWDQMLDTAARALRAPALETELAEAKKKLSEYEKREADQKAKQKANLSKVPGVGQRGGSGDSGTMIADRILNDYYGPKGRRDSLRATGRRSQKPPDLKAFTAEFKRRSGIYR